MSYTSARFLPFGDNALLVEIGDKITSEINRKVIALNEAIINVHIKGVEELVPTYRSLLIRYNPLETTHEQIISRILEIEKILEDMPTETKARKIVIPVIYGGTYGPDLNYVAKTHGLTEEQVVKLHSERVYRVYMIGFVAGFPYLGEVPDEIATPRLATPRLKVHTGSVGIAEKQTGIYPCEAPGGWQIIGRTPVKLFNHLWQPPALLKPGDMVKFQPITEAEFRKIEELVQNEAYIPRFEDT
ncbi:5-oxoprolinase subunit PxpB [Candidatus Bathyarchaeota archaeon]|nr:5-oxoprolinase subunit PxpB [Candidatus Bathyarchaeota archaeon]